MSKCKEHLFDFLREEGELCTFYCRKCLFFDSKNRSVKEGKDYGA